MDEPTREEVLSRIKVRLIGNYMLMLTWHELKVLLTEEERILVRGAPSQPTD